MSDELDDAATIHDDVASAPAVDARPREPTQQAYDLRYQPRRQLGRGGMGEVHLCHDSKIGRDVAVKVMRARAASDRIARDRFLRESRVQAQLEHPGVVPIYDIGITPGGQPYMAMKRVRGTTLHAVLSGLAAGDAETVERHPRASLLSVMERVCETIAYAHARGVVHRDLKPANVMVGDFGEVHVLDWGVAKVHDDADLEPASSTSGDDDPTRPGSVLGTVGYMAPEQATGDSVDASADVYSLGAMLYQVVTLERLHPESTVEERIARTMRGIDARPSSRVPGVAPELDAICVRATELLRSKRYPSAGELLVDLRKFLAGQRATELRREIAERHAEAARTTLARADDSAKALRELGAAVVLDPENKEMIRMIEALLAPDAPVPAEVDRELETARRKSASGAAGRASIAWIAGSLILGLIAWMGVRDWIVFSVLAGGLVVNSAGALAMARSGRSTGITAWLAAPFAFSLVGMLSTLVSPLFLVPAAVVATSVAYTISVRPTRALQRFIHVCAWAAMLVPIAAQRLGWLSPSTRFHDGVIELMPWLAAFPEVPTTIMLAVTSVFLVTASTVLVSRAVDSLAAAERRLAAQAHRLRAMLPAAPA